MVNVLTPTLIRVLRSRHLHICCLRSPAPALVVPCSRMPVATSVNQNTLVPKEGRHTLLHSTLLVIPPWSRKPPLFVGSPRS